MKLPAFGWFLLVLLAVVAHAASGALPGVPRPSDGPAGNHPGEPDRVVPLATATVPFGTLEDVPETASLAGGKLSMTCHPWVNMEPSPGPDSPNDRHLSCKVKIRLGGSNLQPEEEGFEADRLWLFHEDEVWETPLGVVSRQQGITGREIEAMAQLDPVWNGTVTAVVRILDRTSSATIYLRAPEAQISFVR
ncbi:MAG: hypothetical protein GX442_06960 [Candidatus Riflebacteria bacterium]|nr:hypothetical protein [Candidatus Riflebacteria bacterium]